MNPVNGGAAGGRHILPSSLFERLPQTDTSGGTFITQLKEYLAEGDEILRAHFTNGLDSLHLVKGRTELIDQLLRFCWREKLADQAHSAALVAVGGYGRGELLPGSDVDLMILLPDEGEQALAPSLEALLTLLWDIGLEVGHSVRTVADCAEQSAADITVATNMQEARLLAGDEALYERMRDITGPAHIWPVREFFEAKLAEQQARHLKFGETAYNLEPNIKENPGGLRDIQMIGWVAKRHFGADSLRELVAHEFLTEGEYDALMQGQSFLWRVRFALHTLARRREDRLLFDFQRSLAEQLGYQAGDSANLAVEHFMKDYYRTVMELNRLNEILLQHFKEAILHADDPQEPLALSKRFQVRKGFLEVVDSGVFQRYPFALLELFLEMAQHPEIQGVRAQTIRLVRAHRYLIDDDFRIDLRARSIFMEILRQKHGVTHELRRMNRYGVLAAYIPAFQSIVGQMQYDLFHAYTVDEHTLFVVRNLRRFAVPKWAHELPFCSRLIKDIPKPELLTLAGLFHDIAKGRGGDHSELGAVDALEFCLHHGLSPHDAELVSWLVRNHLFMSSTAQRRDISDPEVINEFAQHVGQRMRLDYLYLLTVADIRGTNPAMWNSWKDSLLTELYQETAKALHRGLQNPLQAGEEEAGCKGAARALLSAEGVAEADIESVWQRLVDSDYFLRHTPDQVAWHTRSILRHKDPQVTLVQARESQERGATELMVYRPVHRALLTVTTSLLAQLGLNIADARLFTSDDNYAIDTYLVLTDAGTPVHAEDDLDRVVATLRDGLDGRSPEAIEVTRSAPRSFQHFDVPTRISIRPATSSERSMVEIIAQDRPGLLHDIARAFSEFEILLHNARISTFGSRAEDAFYITDGAGEPLTDPKQIEGLRAELERVLAED